MQTVAPSTPAPTHVAFFAFAPDSRTPFHFSPGETDEYDRAIVDLMTRFPGKGIPTVEALTAAPEKAIDVAAVAESVARDGADAKVAAPEKRCDPYERRRLALAREHGRKLPLRAAAEELRERVRSEERRDLIVSARDLSRQVESNGRLRFAGFAAQPQAIKGLLNRIESPATRYVFGLRSRIIDCMTAIQTLSTPDVSGKLGPIDTAARTEAIRRAIDADKAKLAEVLVHELYQAGDVELKLRTRGADGDVFAVVSPSYGVADAPELIDQIIDALPEDMRGSWAYDPSTTAWELRAEIWTPTPVSEQQVGEPFNGYVSFRSEDDGTAKLKGGGGICILSCLNSMTRTVNEADVSRRHSSRVLVDAPKMIAKCRSSIDDLCHAWGLAREEDLSPAYEAMIGLPVSQAVPGFWWGEFGDRKSELHHVLRGSTKAHVAGLTDMTIDQRVERGRASDSLTKADLVQGWTKYIQRLPGAERRDAEAAAASWVVSKRPVRFDGDRIEG